jgi:hypothetical protein
MDKSNAYLCGRKAFLDSLSGKLMEYYLMQAIVKEDLVHTSLILSGKLL